MKSDRMMIYCWEETAYPNEPKVGEHWVNNMTLDDAINDTIYGRIRASLGTRKDHFDRGDRIQVKFVIDASDYAKRKNKFYPRAKLDSELHRLIEGRYGLGEVFDCSYQHVEDVVTREIGPINTSAIETKIKSKAFRTMIKVKDRKNCVLTEGDPEPVWAKVVSAIPLCAFTRKKPKILVAACGYGTEITLLVQTLKSLGWSDVDIKKSITINDRSDQFTTPWEDAGYRVIVGDFLYLEFGMKFDIIIGNPPYQDSGSNLKSAKLYPKFFTKCFDDLLKDDGFLAFVTPNAWQSAFNSLNEKSRNKEMDRMKQVMREYYVTYLALEDTRKMFPDVGSSFSSYVVQKTTSKGNTYFEDHQEIGIIPSLDILPKIMNSVSLDLFKKMQSSPVVIPIIEGGSFASLGFHSSPVDKDTNKPVESKGGQHTWELLHTNVKNLYSNVEHPLQKTRKVLASLSGYFKPFYDDGRLGLTEACVAIEVRDEHEAQNVIDILNSKLFKTLLDLSKFTGFTNQYALKKLAFVSDLSRSWTDQELYDHFELSDEVVRFIEAYD